VQTEIIENDNEATEIVDTTSIKELNNVDKKCEDSANKLDMLLESLKKSRIQDKINK
jgi:hypothetical protein